MGLFKNKYERELDAIIFKIEMNMSNNYKDNAQMDLQDFEDTFKELCIQGKLKEKTKLKYESILETYRIKLKGYTHKDQKPYWT
ncbi:MAG: hypothetical protein K5669_00500 [Lachnospiraceae bacterium]|nr:hypothetical protein [Lachnospiraceae bacterium]